MATPDRPIITLTTDFGLSDPYVAAMKGAILAIRPDATIVDVSHDVRPQRIAQAAFLTQSAWPHFPEGAVHVAVVDPGVGTGRRAIVMVTPQGAFVGPDNGVLSAALPDETRPQAEAALVPLPGGCHAYEITNPRLMREPVSSTFHGRDVFAPAAAHLSLGTAASECGPAVDSIFALPPLQARRDPSGSLRARVVHVDRFGNVVLDARAVDLPEGALVVEIAGEQVSGPARTYAAAEGLVALVGSAGYLEVALPGGSAAAALGVDIDDEALVRPGR